MSGRMSESVDELQSTWKAVEIEFLVLASLALQIILIFFAGHRKRWVSRWLALLLWLTYLLADQVAIYTLGFLSNSRNRANGDPCRRATDHRNDQLHAFWAPFLILHLGGPDTITSFSLEDNELWLRHLLTLVFQVTGAAQVIIKSLPGTRLFLPAALMFTAGLLKYIERTLALRSASMNCLRDSLVTPPDPGPNYAKFMEEFASSKEAGLPANIVAVKERRVEIINPDVLEETSIDYSTVVSQAYRFFLTFKRLVVDLILSFEHRTESQSFFLQLAPAQAFKVIEVELAFMYELLHTKAALIHTIVGRLIRSITWGISLTTLLLFLNTEKVGYRKTDVIITYVLLGGALVLETYAIGLMFLSLWTVIHLKGCKYGRRLAKLIFAIVERIQPVSRPSWSNSMAQYNLISLCLRDRPTTWRKIMSFFGVRELWDQHWYTAHLKVLDGLKEHIFRELKSKASSIGNPADYKELVNCRGEWTLQQRGYLEALGKSVQAEFDESILLWHIATDLCYYHDEAKKKGKKKDDEDKEAGFTAAVLHFLWRFCGSWLVGWPARCHDWCCEGTVGEPESQSKTSCEISNYMLYLLVIRPFMLPAGIGQIRFGDTCAEAKNFFQRGKKTLCNCENACQMLLTVKADYPPSDVNGDRSKSILFDACRLAKELLKIEPAEKRWKVISAVWVEMLCYAASKCRANFHVKQLTAGGELLTFVWLLMTHLGIGEQYRIEAGHASAKLIVQK